MKRRIAVLSGLLGLLFGVGLVHAASDATLQASDALTILPPAKVSVQAGYATLHNRAADPLTIVGVDSPAFDRADLHETRQTDGLMHMHPALPRTLLAGERLVMSPGGVHVMFRGPRLHLHAGDTVPVFLTLDNGTRVRIDLIVKESPRPVPARGGHDHAH